MNRKDLELYFKLDDMITSKIMEISKELFGVNNNNYEDFEFGETGIVYVYYSEESSCGYSGTEGYSFDETYLFMSLDEIRKIEIEKEKENHLQEKLKKEKEQQEKLKKEKLEKEKLREFELKELSRLKEKYEK